MTVLVAVLHSLVKVKRHIFKAVHFLMFPPLFFLQEVTFITPRFLPQLL